MFRRVGDSVVLVDDSAAAAPVSPLEQAQAMIAYLHEHGFGGAWVGARDLEDTIYAVFLRPSGRPPLPWLTIARALGGITKKRVKEFAHQGREYKRHCVTQYYVPLPGRRHGGRGARRDR